MNPTNPEKCWTCKWRSPTDGKTLEQGICRLKPPVPNLVVRGDGTTATITIWPLVTNDRDWCSKYEPKLGVH